MHPTAAAWLGTPIAGCSDVGSDLASWNEPRKPELKSPLRNIPWATPRTAHCECPAGEGRKPQTELEHWSQSMTLTMDNVYMHLKLPKTLLLASLLLTTLWWRQGRYPWPLATAEAHRRCDGGVVSLASLESGSAGLILAGELGQETSLLWAWFSHMQNGANKPKEMIFTKHLAQNLAIRNHHWHCYFSSYYH